MPSQQWPARLRGAGLPRRRALALGAAAIVIGTTGCGLRLESGPAPIPPPAPPTVDELARERVAAQADRLLALVAGVRRTRPDLTRELGQVAAGHRAHTAALRPGSTPSPTPASLTPTTSLTTLATLLTAERAAVSAVLVELPAVTPSLARLLAGVAAALQVHVELLSTRPPR